MATQEINVRLPSMYGNFYFTVKNSELIGDTLSGVLNISNMIGKTIGLLTVSFETDGSTITNIHIEDCSIVPIEINSNDYDINFTFTLNTDNSPVNFVITNLPVTYYDDLDYNVMITSSFEDTPKMEDALKINGTDDYTMLYQSSLTADGYLEIDDLSKLTDFGTFAVKTRQERNGTNPQTKQKIVIPAAKTVGFKVSKGLKEKL